MISNLKFYTQHQTKRSEKQQQTKPKQHNTLTTNKKTITKLNIKWRRLVIERESESGWNALE